MAVLFTLGLLTASWLGVTVLAGILFVLGCGLAAWFTRPADLLIVVLTPPILLSGALVFAEAVTAPGSLLLSVATGSVVVLVSLAPWLAAGLIVTVAIAVPRGLPQSVGDLVRDLRADAARRKVARAAKPAGAASLSRHPLRRPAPAGPARPGLSGARRPGGTRAAAGLEPALRPAATARGRAGLAAVRAAGRTASAPESPRRPEHR